MTEKEMQHLLKFHKQRDHRLTVQALTELAALRQQLAEARATIEAKTATIDAAEQTITRLEKVVDALVVQREDALTQLAAQAAELERLREELSEADWIIGSTNNQAGNHAEARHTLTPALRDSIHRYILKWHSTGSET